MAERPLDFHLYRLIVEDESDKLNFMGRPVGGDPDIIAILRQSVVGEGR
jgi:hypothetical protein